MDGTVDSITGKRFRPEIWILADRSGSRWTTATLEMLDDAYALTQKVGWSIIALVLSAPGHVRDKDCHVLAAHGAHEVHLLEHDAFASFGGSVHFAEALCQWAAAPPRMIIGSCTPLWVDCLGHLAALWGGVMVTHGISFRLAADDELEVCYQSWQDKAHITVALSPERVWCVALRPNVAGVGRERPWTAVKIVRESLSTLSQPVKSQEVISPSPKDLDLKEAERIVAGGRGVGGPDGFLALESLARKLNAVIGATRVAVDLGWAPYDRQVGQTGKTVKPRLYLAAGISGASQHADGMRESEVIIAINQDRTANIFNIAHLGIVGDAVSTVRALADLLGERNG